MNAYDWPARFKALHGKALRCYESGSRDAALFFDPEERDFLASIGTTPAELYDFAEDHPDLSFETALLITAVRKDYFHQVQKGVWSRTLIDYDAFPAKSDELSGIPWVPRIIWKAKARLRGELPPDLMYCCGGDRNFLSKYNIHPADFLRLVWRHWDDEAEIVRTIASIKPHL